MNSRSRLRLCVFTLMLPLTGVSYAQTPNTGSIVVVAEDQNGAVVRDAKVSVTNSATGATRDAVTGSDGSATIPALSLTGGAHYLKFGGSILRHRS